MPKNTTQCPRPGLEPGALAPESSALTMRPPHLHTCTVKGVINSVNLLKSHKTSRILLISIHFSLRGQPVSTKRAIEVIKILEEKEIMKGNDKYQTYL